MKTYFSVLLLILCLQVHAQVQQKAEKVYGGTGSDVCRVIVPTQDGGYLLAGSSDSDSSATKSQNHRSTGTDYWIIRINKKGQRVWDKTYGGSDGDVITCAKQTSDKGFILGGYSFSGEGYDKTGYNRGATDYQTAQVICSGIKRSAEMIMIICIPSTSQKMADTCYRAIVIPMFLLIKQTAARAAQIYGL